MYYLQKRLTTRQIERLNTIKIEIIIICQIKRFLLGKKKINNMQMERLIIR